MPTKVYLVKTMAFLVSVCESWTIKKAEHWRIDAFELWCWRRLLRVPWTSRRSNQPILKEISPEYSLIRLMLKLKLQYFGHLMWRTDSLEKTLMLGKIEGRRRRGWQRMGWLDGITDLKDMSLSKLQVLVIEGKPGVLQSMRSQRVRHDCVTELNWTDGLYSPPVSSVPRQEYWVVLPFPSPRDRPNSGLEPMSPAIAGGFFTTEPPEKPATSNHTKRRFRQL